MFYFILRFLLFILAALDFLIILSITFLFALLPMCLTKYFMPELTRRMMRRFMRLLGVVPHIHQKYKEAPKGHYILISNHPSGVDIILLCGYFPVFPLAKEEVQDWWFFGRIARALGTVFVKREDRTSRRTAKKSLIDCVSTGKNLLIYPEGGCFGKHLRPFKYGAFDISILSGIPILPVYIQYEAEDSMQWKKFGLIKHLLTIFRSPNKNVHCYIFDKVDPSNFNDAGSFCNYVHKLYETWEAKYRL